jgi:hypothetical protein
VKIGEPFYAAVNSEGRAAHSPESDLIAGDSVEDVERELRAWHIPLQNYTIKKVILTEAEEGE